MSTVDPHKVSDPHRLPPRKNGSQYLSKKHFLLGNENAPKSLCGLCLSCFALLGEPHKLFSILVFPIQEVYVAWRAVLGAHKLFPILVPKFVFPRKKLRSQSPWAATPGQGADLNELRRLQAQAFHTKKFGTTQRQFDTQETI